MQQALVQASLILTFAMVLSAQLPLRQRLVGEPAAALGTAILSLPDIDGDGISEVVVAAPIWDSTNSGLAAGRVQIYSGQSQALIRSHQGQVGEKLGWALCQLGDIDADNVCDYAIGAPGLDRVHVYSGQTGAFLRYDTGAANQGYGRILHRLSDIDGDGIDEMVLGLPLASSLHVGDGRVLVLSGATGLLLRDYHGDSAGDQFGAALAEVSDVDGDGLADLVIGAPEDDIGAYNAGSCYVISTSTGQILNQQSGTMALERFGSAVVTLNDLDGGGSSDFAVGAPFAGSQSQGRVALCSSETGLVLLDIVGTEASARFGTTLAAGDFNSDGLADLAVGSPYGPGLALGAGHVDLFIGPNFEGRAHFPGSQSFDLFGFALEALGDLNGDGFAELGIGILGSDLGGTNAGEMQVVSYAGIRHYGTASNLNMMMLPESSIGNLRTMQVSGGKPGAIGSIGVSFGAADFQAFGLQVLINWAPSVLVLDGLFGFDLNGETSFPVNIRTPWLQGNNLFLQAYDRDFPFAASSGVEMRFGL